MIFNTLSEISGGTINASFLDFSIWTGAGAGSINFSGPGQMIVAGTPLEMIQGWIDDGHITNAQANFVEGVGTIVTIPEPATLVLLGIGSIAMMRRKK